MHDAARQSIELDDHVRVQIMEYLTENFSNMIPKEKSRVYLFGLFFGKNLNFIPRVDPKLFLPSHIYEYMKSNRYFGNCVGLGLGIGKNFSSLRGSLQQEMLEKAKKIHIFDQGLGFGSF